MPESVRSAYERGTDISGHHARLLTNDMIDDADLVVCLATEHRAAVAGHGATARAKAFTLKELVRILEPLPAAAPGNDPDTLLHRVAEADAVRRKHPFERRRDEDVADPLGGPFESYRAMALELDEWIGRLVGALFGVVTGKTESDCSDHQEWR